MPKHRLLRRTLPQTFICKGCQSVITLRQDGQDWRRDYCSRTCKVRAWLRAHADRKYPQRRVCPTCQQPFPSTGPTYCSPVCKAKALENRKAPMVTVSCVQCGTAFVRRKASNKATCSPACRHARLSTQLRGKTYRPAKVYERICTQCSEVFVAQQKQITVCRRCTKRGRGKYRERCRRAGVPYLAGVTPEKVFLRDRYRCQLCGCKTPKRLRGTYHPNAPELDHIIPINAKGGSPGHVWGNVQCACRQCNIRKCAKPLGQMRLAV